MTNRKNIGQPGKRAGGSETPTGVSDTDALLTEHDLARRQNRSVKTIRNQRVQGGGVPFIKIGRLVRYRPSDATRYEDRHRCHSTSDEKADTSDEEDVDE